MRDLLKLLVAVVTLRWLFERGGCGCILTALVLLACAVILL